MVRRNASGKDTCGSQPRVDWMRQPLLRGHGARILGEKPPEFVTWVLECCRVERSDEIVDVFPGSGAVGEAIDMWRRQGVLPGVLASDPGEIE